MPNVEGKIDIRYRNGMVVRRIEAKQRRWEPWPFGETPFDIVDWQPNKG